MQLCSRGYYAPQGIFACSPRPDHNCSATGPLEQSRSDPAPEKPATVAHPRHIYGQLAGRKLDAKVQGRLLPPNLFLEARCSGRNLPCLITSIASDLVAARLYPSLSGWRQPLQAPNGSSTHLACVLDRPNAEPEFYEFLPASSSKVTATSAFADSRTLLPSVSATKSIGM